MDDPARRISKSDAAAAPAGAPAGDHHDSDDAGEAAGSDDDPGDRSFRLQIDVAVEHQDVDDALASWLQQQLTRIAALAGVEAGSLSVALVDDPAMCDLHNQFMQDPTTTDVLTFDLSDDDDDDDDDAADESDAPQDAPAVIDGEVIICVDEAARQAEQIGHELRLELLLYGVHGLLHLLGYDDRDPADFDVMHKKEDQLLVAAGFDPVYSRSR